MPEIVDTRPVALDRSEGTPMVLVEYMAENIAGQIEDRRLAVRLLDTSRAMSEVVSSRAADIGHQAASHMRVDRRQEHPVACTSVALAVGERKWWLRSRSRLQDCCLMREQHSFLESRSHPRDRRTE